MMKTIQGYFLIAPDDLHWRLSNIMKIPNADFLEKTGSQNLGVLVQPDKLRQVFDDTDAEVLRLIMGAPEETQFLPGAKTKSDMSRIYPVDPKQLPKELAGVEWPPKG